MVRKILVILGHPDASGGHLGHALADAYEEGAREGGHDVRRLDVASLEFPLLRSKAEFDNSQPPPSILHAQQDIRWADHLVFLYPLWLGDMPALLKGFLEQAFRPGFALEANPKSLNAGLLKGRSARIVVTMGMPALFYRWYFWAHSVKSFKRNLLRFCGIRPVRMTLLGMVEGSAGRREKWLSRMKTQGRRAA